MERLLATPRMTPVRPLSESVTVVPWFFESGDRILMIRERKSAISRVTCPCRYSKKVRKQGENSRAKRPGLES